MRERKERRAADAVIEKEEAQFKRWQIDYLKSDPCYGHMKSPPAEEVFNEYNRQWDAAFRRIDYLDSVFFQGSGPGRATNSSTFPLLMNSWRTTGDVKPTFESVVKNIHENDQYAGLAGPGHWVSSKRALYSLATLMRFFVVRLTTTQLTERRRHAAVRPAGHHPRPVPHGAQPLVHRQVATADWRGRAPLLGGRHIAAHEC